MSDLSKWSNNSIGVGRYCQLLYNTHTREYECKCGCVFEVNFIAENPKILDFPIDKLPKVCYNKYRK
jgi:hypothetical protein